MKKNITQAVFPLAMSAVLFFSLFLFFSGASQVFAAPSCSAPQVSCGNSCTTPYCTTNAQCQQSFGPASTCLVFAGGCANTCTLTAGGGTGLPPVVLATTPATLSINGSSFSVGDNWTVSVTGPASTPFSYCAQQSGSAATCTPSFGTTDGNGNWSKSGTFQTADAGAWTEYVKFQDSGAETSPQIAFSVAPSTASGPGTTSGSSGALSIVNPFSGGIPPIQVNQSYSYQFSVLNPGTDNYTWTAQGTLPAGMSLGEVSGDLANDSARLWGTPSAVGSYNFSIQVMDNVSSKIGTENFSGTVTPSTLGTASSYLAQATALASQNGGTVMTLSSGAGLAGYAINFGGMVMNASVLATVNSPASVIASWQQAYAVTTSFGKGYNGLPITWAFNPASGGLSDYGSLDNGSNPWYIGTDSAGNQYAVNVNPSFAANTQNLPVTFSSGTLMTHDPKWTTNYWVDPTNLYDYGSDGLSGTSYVKVPLLMSLSATTAAPGTDVTISGSNIYAASGGPYYVLQFLNASGNVVVPPDFRCSAGIQGCSLSQQGSAINSLVTNVTGGSSMWPSTTNNGTLVFTMPTLPAGNYSVRLKTVGNSIAASTGTSNTLPITVTAGNGTYGVTGATILFSDGEGSSLPVESDSTFNADVTSPLAHGTPWNVKSGDTISIKVTNAQPNVPVILDSSAISLFGLSGTLNPGSASFSYASIGKTDSQGDFTYTSPALQASLLQTPGNSGATEFEFAISIGNDPLHARQLGNMIYVNFGSGTSVSVTAGSGTGSTPTGGTTTTPVNSSSTGGTPTGNPTTNPTGTATGSASLTLVNGYNPHTVIVSGLSETSNYVADSALYGSYIVLFGAFGDSGNTVMIDGQAVPASQITFQGASQINVELGGASVGNHTVSVSSNIGTTNSVAFSVVASASMNENVSEGSASTTVTSSGGSTDNSTLQEEIAALQAQVAALESELTALQQGQGASASNFCYDFTNNLSIGQSGADVTALQTALQHDGETVSVTDTFDEQTAAAVTAFQEKYATAVLVPEGLANGTGYVGPSTRAELNILYPCGTASGTGTQ